MVVVVEVASASRSMSTPFLAAYPVAAVHAGQRDRYKTVVDYTGLERTH